VSFTTVNGQRLSSSEMTKKRISFIEWMKAFGMFVIIYGHTSGHALFNPTLPVNFKQIGVVFFIVATGYLLANETRKWPTVFFNRLFELFFFGIMFSVLMTFVSLYQIGDLSESNYLPFALGANVLFNSFPANPSLWYIGTYIHLLIVWAVFLRHLRVKLWMFLLVVPAEVIIRSLLMANAGDFIAYQALTNWASVLLFGMYLGQQSAGDRLDASQTSLVAWVAALALVVATWMWITKTVGVTESNPFGRLVIGGKLFELATTALSISLIYLSWAVLGFQIFRRLRAGAIVQFFGRNSMLCFIVHMPLVFSLSKWLYTLPGVDEPGLFRLAVNVLVFYVGVCLLSEWLRKVVRPIAVKNALERQIGRFLGERAESSN
jgi:hypothetical protein